MANKEDFEKLLTLLNEKEVLLKERELALDEQQEEFMAQKEELHAAVDEVMAKNIYLSETLEKLKVRNEELDQILYRASHDLKTPVSSILGLITMMRSTGINPEQNTIVDHLLQKTKQMDSLLTSLSRLSIAFFQQLKPEPHRLTDLIFDAWKQVNADASIHFDCQVENCTIVTDKRLLIVLLICLLENAVTFSKPDVKNHVVVAGDASGEALTLSITDFGEDIPADLSAKIFEMFFRGSVRSTGPGLGLYVAQIIAQRLNGRITLENAGQGKKFIVTLEMVKR